MRELSVAEQRYKAALAVIGEGKTVTEVAVEWRVSRQTLHTWLARYEAGGLEQLARRNVAPLPSQSALYRCLVSAGVVPQIRGGRRIEHWKRWERA